MGLGYLLGGIFCVLYSLGVGIFGGIKKSPMLLKLTKQKLGKTMSDEKAAKIDLIMGIFMGLVGIFLFVFGAIQA